MNKRQILVKKIKSENLYEAFDTVTKLVAYDSDKYMAIFKLGRLVEKQMTLPFKEVL